MHSALVQNQSYSKMEKRCQIGPCMRATYLSSRDKGQKPSKRQPTPCRQVDSMARAAEDRDDQFKRGYTRGYARRLRRQRHPDRHLAAS
jgi:hypothetical protein